MDILAIVGRPNVGKSALFNRIVGRRIAIVHEQAGVTRDRISALAHWENKTFEVVDTGGLAFLDNEKSTDALADATRHQAEIAITMATALVLVVDVTAGVSPLDREIARKLRTSGKPVFLAVNKVDNPQRERNVPEFAALGFPQLFPIAAIHGLGIDGLLEQVTAPFPAPVVAADGSVPAAAPTPVRVAIVGRPNVGKSSLINCLLAQDRSIVSEVPGTTRDAVDAPITIEGDGQLKPYVLVDTAGLRHKSKIKTSVDQFGLMRAEESIRNCDVAVLVLDAVEGVRQQDKHIGGLIAAAGRGCVILVNKWDLVKKESGRAAEPQSGIAAEPQNLRAAEPQKFRAERRGREARRDPAVVQREEYLDGVRRSLFFLDWAAVLFGSAKTGEHVRDVFRLVDRVQEQMRRRVETPRLNQLLGRAQDSYPPPLVRGKRLRILYAYQSRSSPPTFTLFVNDARAVTPHYEKHLISRLRAGWDFEGCPVRLEYRTRLSAKRPGQAKFRGKTETLQESD